MITITIEGFSLLMKQGLLLAGELSFMLSKRGPASIEVFISSGLELRSDTSNFICGFHSCSYRQNWMISLKYLSYMCCIQ